MSNTPNTDKVREQIAQKIFYDFEDYAEGTVASITWKELYPEIKLHWLNRADQILSMKGLWVEAENQELPSTGMTDSLAKERYGQDMLKANFIKVEPKGVNTNG